MSGLTGHWYIFVILGVIALIIFGPARLPELGAGLGRAIKEFRKGASEMTDSFKEEMSSKPADGVPTATGTTYTANPEARSDPEAPKA